MTKTLRKDILIIVGRIGGRATALMLKGKGFSVGIFQAVP